jgi:pimeloyl-ACP methyl ester carboxylesterase
MESRLIAVAGGRARIRVYEGGSGPDLVFLHGAGLIPGDPTLATLARKFRVHAPLLPGFEDSEGADLRDMLDFVLHSFDVIDALGLDKPILVGHSMGGMIAAEMAAVAPHQVDKLGLICPAGLWLDEHPIPDLFAMLPYEFPPMLFHDVKLGEELMTRGVDLDDVAFLETFLVNASRSLGTAGKILFPIPERGLKQRMYRIRARTVIVWGSEDRLTVPAYGTAFQQGIPGSKLIVIPDAGHEVNIEKPEGVLAALAELL